MCFPSKFVKVPEDVHYYSVNVYVCIYDYMYVCINARLVLEKKQKK